MKRERKDRHKKEAQQREHPQGWITSFPLPRDTARLLRLKHDQCLNLGLWLDHYVAWHSKSGNVVPERMPKANRREAPMLSKVKGEDFEYLALSGLDDLAAACARRQADVLSDYRRWGYALEVFQARPEWCMVVGLGGASVLETDITLHHLYGFPVIPGSALKGLARSYALLDERRDEDDLLFTDVFGTVKDPKRAGGVIFFDALPITRPHFQLDVMNPHYGEYYRGQAPPADYLNPVPVYFLTATRTTFLFALAARDGQQGWLRTAIGWLQKGLETMGIGAKTTAGYGYFVLEEVT